MQNLIQQIKKAPLVTCQIMPPTPLSKRGFRLNFSQEPPEEPGVYLVYQRNPERPFYVGEAGDLSARLKYLFRCYRNNNPHPCHINHHLVYEEWPEVDTFCELYGVRWITTNGLYGRIEIEDEIKRIVGTNCKTFYQDYDPSDVQADMEFWPTGRTAPNCLGHNEKPNDGSGECTGHSGSPTNGCEGCHACPTWQDISTDPKYQNPQGTPISSMGGRADHLFFRYDPSLQEVHVWRQSGRTDFRFDENIWKMICRRYQQGLKNGSLPQPPESGGSGYFTIPKWTTPPLGMINTPYAAAVIRHFWP